MLGRPLELLTARLCLAAALLMGVSPGQGVVLCVGPEGTLSLEVASEEARCGGCPELAGQEGERSRAALGDPADCPCSDYPVIAGNGQARAKPRPVEVDVAQLARVPVPFGASIAASRGPSVPVAARVGTGSDQRLKALCTVVLRV